MPTKYYGQGLSGEYLKVDGDVISSIELIDKSYLLIECDITKNEMRVMTKERNATSWSILIVDNEISSNTDSKDESWNGKFYESQPFGYGDLFREKTLVYSGFMYKGNKVCYGIEYNPVNKEENCYGYYFKGKKIDSRKNNTIVDYFGFNMLRDHFNPIQTVNLSISNTLEESKILYNIRELKINIRCKYDNSSFILKHYQYLEIVDIDDNCSFSNCSLFIIEDCNRLKRVVINDGCFCKEDPNDGIIKDGVFRIKNCSELEVIHIGKKSFYDIDGELVIECIFD